MKEFATGVHTSKTLKVALVLATVGFAATSTPAVAAQLTGATIAPNWAFGSPQPASISGCSDVIGAACIGSFGLGPLSDVLRINFLGRPAGTEASLSENQRFFVFGLLETGNESIGDWWNLWIPTARWVGFGPNAGILWFMRDANDVAAGDAIAYVNINNAAHILWASNNSDEADATLPADFLALLANLSVTENTVTINADGSFINTNVPPPTPMDCTADPACTPTAGFVAVPTSPAFIPEPSTWITLAGGLSGILGGLRKSRRA